MNMLATLKSDDTAALPEEKDTLGGGYSVLESGAYPAKIGFAYVAKSEGGALGLFLTFITEGDKELRQTLWMTSGNEKGNKPYYLDKDQNKQPLPGFSQAKSLALLTTGKDISELDEEEKVIKLYNKDAKAEIPTKVTALVELIGQDVVIGVIKQTVDKTVKNEAGQYVANGETRDENEIDKFFCGREGYENMTTTEIKAKGTAEFYGEWVQKWTGITRSKVKGAAAAGTPGAPKGTAAAAGTPKPKSSLFG